MSSATVKTPPRHDDHADESMIVRLSRLDHMLELAGEVIIVSSNLNALSRNIREGQSVDHDLAEDVKDLAITSNRISSDLHSLVTDVRTVDMTDLFARFRRLARDTSRRLGKAVRFEVEGEEVCIDKKTSEKIYDPIAHQIRNAIAHGIEDEATRTAAGKEPVGLVRLVVRNMENATHVQVIDDGRGVDLAAVRAKGVERGLFDAAAAERMNPRDLLDCLYLPGFSTAASTSTTSGRGVGMDVIRTVMNEIGGETRIETAAGEGTTFTFMLPRVTAVNISDALLVRAHNTYFAFPVLSVIATQSVPKSEVTRTVGRHRSIYYLDHVLPLFDLMEVFGEYATEDEADELRVIILEHKHQKLAFVVSEFLNPQKIVITELDDMIKVPGLTGTAVLSGRQMCMVVDLPRLFEQTLGAGYDAAGAVGAGFDADWGMGPVETSPQLARPPQAVEEQPRAEAAPDEDGSPALAEANSEFLHEVESMLSKVNQELLTLEDQRDNETADGVFRLMHSIKGNFTMYGAEHPAAVTHRLESILERARRGERELTDEVFDVLFDGAAHLEEVVRAQLNHDAPPATPETLQAALEAMTADPAATSDIAAVDDETLELDATGEFYLSSRRRDGASLYRCRIEFDPGDQPHFLVAYLILRRIQRVADVLGTQPGMAAIEQGLCGGALAVLIAPRDRRDDLPEALEANLKRYFGVTHFSASPYA